MPKARKSAKETAAMDNEDLQQQTSAVQTPANIDGSSVAELNYEKAFEQLERVLVQLESDDLALDQSLALYEQGVALVGRCSELLDSATLRVQQWQENGTTAPFTGWQEG